MDQAQFFGFAALRVQPQGQHGAPRPALPAADVGSEENVEVALVVAQADHHAVLEQLAGHLPAEIFQAAVSGCRQGKPLPGETLDAAAAGLQNEDGRGRQGHDPRA